MNTDTVEHYAKGSYSRYANLLDDILVSILFGFDKDGRSKCTFPNSLHHFVLVHISGMTATSCWFCRDEGAYCKAMLKLIRL